VAEVVLGSGDLNETLDQLDLLRRAGEQDRDVLESVKETRRQLAASRGELLRLRSEAVESEREARGRRQAMERLLGERRAVLDTARRALASAQAAQAERLAAAQSRQERIIRERAQPSSSSSSRPTGIASNPSPAPSSVSAHLARIAQCESGGNPRAVSPNGLYRGKYQFHPDTWRAVGGTGDPAAAPEAEQDRLAAVLYSREGASPWPICGS
jgi:soluble lytic murein transglycosylase-like protein